mgnify:CR=1 FL=1
MGLIFGSYREKTNYAFSAPHGSVRPRTAAPPAPYAPRALPPPGRSPLRSRRARRLAHCLPAACPAACVAGQRRFGRERSRRRSQRPLRRAERQGRQSSRSQSSPLPLGPQPRMMICGSWHGAAGARRARSLVGRAWRAQSRRALRRLPGAAARAAPSTRGAPVAPSDSTRL